MSTNWPKPHHGHASEYQVSSWPFLTSSNVGTSAVEIRFPYVTRWVSVGCNTSMKTVSFGFSQLGTNGTVTNNFFTVPNGVVAGPFEVKCTSLWIKGSDTSVAFSVAAGLTNVKDGDFPAITGSNGFAGVG